MYINFIIHLYKNVHCDKIRSVFNLLYNIILCKFILYFKMIKELIKNLKKCVSTW